MRVVCLLVPLVLSMSPAAVRAADPVEIPFTRSPRGHILVPVRVDDGPARTFVLDTAAGLCTIAPGLAAELELPTLEEGSAAVGEFGTTRHDVVVLDDLRVGDRSKGGLRAHVRDLEPFTRGAFAADGILGAPFLRGFDVRLDFGRGVLTLFDAASGETCAACPEDVEPVGFEMHEQGHILLPASVGEVDVTALLDTGSGHSGINSIAARALGVELPDAPPTGHGFGILTGPIRAGSTVLVEQGPLAVMDRADIFEAFGLVDRPRLLLGTDLLAARVLTISYARKQLWVQ